MASTVKSRVIKSVRYNSITLGNITNHNACNIKGTPLSHDTNVQNITVIFLDSIR